MAGKAPTTERFRTFSVFYGLPAVVLLATLSGCGGGTADNADAAPVKTTGPVSGTVVLQQRRGKLLIDAWFVPPAGVADQTSAENEPAFFQQDNPVNTDVCSVASNVRAPSFPALAAAATSNADNSVRGALRTDTLDIGNAVLLSSRAGEFARLQAHRFKGVTYYASDPLWYDNPLPDDVVLGVDIDSGLRDFVPVSVQPMAPIVRTAPTSGILASASDPVSWQASADTNDVVHLHLSTVVLANDQTTLMDIECVLVDDGEFVLPVTIAQQLPSGHTGIAVGLSRELTVTHSMGESDLSVVQVSYPHP